MGLTSKLNSGHSSKAQLMSIIMLVMFLLMVAELFTFTQLNVSSNQAVQSLAVSSASGNYGNLLKLSANNFARESLSRALQVLAGYESTPSLRKGNFITNTSFYISNIMVGGVLPNDTSGYPQNAMGNLTLTSYNKSIAALLGFASQAITVNETRPVIFQNDSYSIRASYTERILINSSGNLYRFNIPVSVSIPLNNTPDLFYAQHGSAKNVKFANLNNITSVVGGVYATSGNTYSYAYGSVYNVPSSASASATCPLSIPARLNFPPINQSLVIVTYNAVDLGSCIEKYAGLVTYKAPSTPPVNVPYLAYPVSTGILTSLFDGTRLLVYGPGMDLLNIENMRSAIMNNNFFASPFTPSYLDRGSAQFTKQSTAGMFTFSNYDTQAANPGGTGNYVYGALSTYYGGNNPLTAVAWAYIDSGTNGPLFGVASSAPTGGWNMPFLSLSGLTAYGWIWNVNGNSPLSYAVPSPGWHLLAITYTPSGSGTEMFYVDGKNVASGTGQYSPSGALDYWTTYISGAKPPGVNSYLSGSVANVQAYSSVLSPSQIQQLYLQGVGGVPISTNTLLSWWPLNGNANDYSGNGNNGIMNSVAFTLLQNYTRDSVLITPVASQLSPLPGIRCNNVAQCTSNLVPRLFMARNPLEAQSNGNLQTARFNGVNSYIVSKAALPALGTATILWWTNVNSIPASGTGIGPSFCQIYEPTASGASFTSYWDPCTCTGYSSCSVFASLSPPTSTWVMMAYVINGNAITAYSYANKVMTQSTGLIPSASFSIPTQNFYIGSYDGNPVYNHLDGSISNVQLYNIPLTSNQINALFQAGIAGIPYTANLIGWWPLNGDANDYSGNGYNATAVKVMSPYITGGYPGPGLSGIATAANEWQAFGLN